MNPNWIRTTIASLLLAILLRVGLGVPLLSTFIALGIIFITHIVMTEMGTGATTAWGWVKSMGNVAMGVVIFLALRFLAAKAMGLYPIETYGVINDSGGLQWILPGRDISSWILWEICFAMVAGQVTAMWVRGTHKLPVRMVIVGSLAILTLRIAYPRYIDSWATREEVSTTLIDHGVVGASAKGVWVLMFGRPTPSAPTPAGRPVSYAPATPIAECSANPTCSLHVGWDTKIKTGDRPVLVKFHGKTEWIPLSGRRDDKFTLDQFSPGEAQFVSPDSTPVQVQTFPAR